MALGQVRQTVYRWFCPHYSRTTVWFVEERQGGPQVVATTLCDDCGKPVPAENDDEVRHQADRLLAMATRTNAASGERADDQLCA